MFGALASEPDPKGAEQHIGAYIRYYTSHWMVVMNRMSDEDFI